MKLLIITAIVAFESDIKKMLQQANVNTYSFKEVTGVSDTGRESIESNWFAAENNETESILFYAFTKPENVETLFNLAAAFNKLQDTTSQIHVAMVNIEQSTTLTI